LDNIHDPVLRLEDYAEGHGLDHDEQYLKTTHTVVLRVFHLLVDRIPIMDKIITELESQIRNGGSGCYDDAYYHLMYGFFDELSHPDLRIAYDAGETNTSNEDIVSQIWPPS
jgi:hypothetical protein